jgi:pimeloyl-ACP methyl ester carboxylesterase
MEHSLGGHYGRGLNRFGSDLYCRAMRLTNKADPHPLSFRAVKPPKPQPTLAGVHHSLPVLALMAAWRPIPLLASIAARRPILVMAAAAALSVVTLPTMAAAQGATVQPRADGVASSAAASADANTIDNREAATPRLSPCQLEHPQRLTVVAADCGELTVPENSAQPNGRQLHLAFARVPAISRRKHPDPLFVLAGGPGMAATTFYATVAPVFGRIHRDRDIILLDQRGTGGSNPLNCPGGDETDYRATDNDIAAEARSCLEKLSAKADVAQYTTSVAVNDLERLRQVLGYEHINMYGVSYGTRVAQQYLRRFPDHTRALILDGVVPPELTLGAGMALDAEHALDRILARCALETDCRNRFGDPTQDYHDLWQSLQAHGVPVIVANPTTGESTHFEFTRFHLATVLRLSIYSTEQTALLPLLLHEAHESKDYSRLASQFLLLTHAYTDAVAVGMNNTVACTEDIAFYDAKATDRSKLENTFLGTAQLDGLLAICKIWPRGPIDADFHAPVHSAVPVLLLSGSDDPITPPAYADQARRGLTDSLHIVLKDFGHGQLAAPCMDRVMEQFINRASVKGLDTSCTRNDQPMPFFISLNGPPP